MLCSHFQSFTTVFVYAQSTAACCSLTPAMGKTAGAQLFSSSGGSAGKGSISTMCGWEMEINYNQWPPTRREGGADQAGSAGGCHVYPQAKLSPEMHPDPKWWWSPPWLNAALPLCTVQNALTEVPAETWVARRVAVSPAPARALL